MIKTNPIFLLVVCSFAFVPSIVECQFEFQDSDQTGKILPVLQRQVKLQYGNNFDVYFAVLDSMIGNVSIPDEQELITDPYGTLKGMIFFWAVPDQRDPENRDSVVIGMFKNDSIIWSTAPIYKGGVKQIYASLDLNNDGEVDLITFWSPSYTYDQSTAIRIFSWNGNTGRLISDYDQITRETKLITTGSILKLIKTKNGVYELHAYWSNEDDMKRFFPSDPIPTRPWVTYVWNQNKYVIVSKLKK
jgi:hypothetical protein